MPKQPERNWKSMPDRIDALRDFVNALNNDDQLRKDCVDNTAKARKEFITRGHFAKKSLLTPADLTRSPDTSSFVFTNERASRSSQNATASSRSCCPRAKNMKTGMSGRVPTSFTPTKRGKRRKAPLNRGQSRRAKHDARRLRNGRADAVSGHGGVALERP